MDKLIYEIDNSLSKNFTTHLIEKFEKDENKREGVTAGGLISSIKKSTDLLITTPEWSEEIEILTHKLDLGIAKYFETHLKDYGLDYFSDINYSGYQIQRTNPGEYYGWHHDFGFIDPALGTRLITYIWYLNDITSEGYTEFYDGTKIIPTTGKLLLFPATWTYLHQGVSPTHEVKYIVTGWMYAR